MVKNNKSKTDSTSCTETRHQGVDARLDNYAWPFHDLPNQMQLHIFLFRGWKCMRSGGGGISGKSFPIILNWVLYINQLMHLCSQKKNSSFIKKHIVLVQRIINEFGILRLLN